ncbi:MAG: RagB/SusD family nutrient uptake outer membrane protein [Bacteroidales bacterium]|nr:RagB/SusD family nutrient uptake outer membrane protein [Bacteroidales bacterium]
MKKQIYLVFIVAGLFAFNSCSLDKLPSGDIFTEGQKEGVVEPSPEKLQGDINGMTAGLTRFNVLEEEDHFDYGFPAICLILESIGQDMVAPNVGYNHFREPQDYSDKIVTSLYSELIWRTLYYNILNANKILAFAPEGTEDGQLQRFRGQALGFRAFSYLNLVQIYQFTYISNKDKPGVPLILEENDENPRATVEAVYDRIMEDLTEAIDLLEGYRPKNKGEMSQNVAYGLRARANLLMHKWKEAAEDAGKAMSGFRAATLPEVSVPGFNSADASNWIWGILINNETEVAQTGIINWPSMLCSLTGNGYTTLTGTYRSANVNFWNEIPQSDIRKEWFVYPHPNELNEESEEVLNSKLVEDFILDDKNKQGKDIKVTVGEYLGYSLFTNVKFHAYKSQLMNAENASDWPLMRVEEMILIQAEGLAMSGNLSEAKRVLEDFVINNRNSEFKSVAITPEAFQDEVWFQRRMELWGEGFSFFDLMRLEKGITRVDTEGNTLYPSGTQYNLAPNDPVLLYPIPEAEINVNDAIDAKDNNPSAEKPKEVGE